MSHPADTLVSKLNANRASGEGFGAAVARNYRDIGFMGLWNGLPVRIVMIGTLTGLQWMIYVRTPTCHAMATKNLDYSGMTNLFSFSSLKGLFQDLHGLPQHWRRRPCG